MRGGGAVVRRARGAGAWSPGGEGKGIFYILYREMVGDMGETRTQYNHDTCDIH